MRAITAIPAPPDHTNLEAEYALLGALLHESSLTEEVVDFLRADDFAEPVHSRLYAAICRETRAGRKATFLTLKPEFERDEGLMELGGTSYLARLSGEIQGLLAHREIARQIAELASRRRCREQLSRALLTCDDPSQSLNAIKLPDLTALDRGAPQLPVEWVGDVKPVLDGFWLIDGYLAKAGPAAIFGPPGSGKTFLALSIAAHVAEGREWAGRHVEAGFVLYVVAEGQTGFRNRVAAMIDVGELSRTAPFAFIPTPIDLQAPDGDIDDLIATIRAMSRKAQVEPALIVIDTLSKTFGAGSENSDDMARYVANCERISTAFNCLTLIVHHPSKNGDSRSERGHSSLRGGVVTSISVENADGLRTATTIKQKDGQEGETIAFRLKPVPLGNDSRGNEVTTCLVEFVEADGSADTNRTEPKRRLTGQRRVAFETIQTEIALRGQLPPDNIPRECLDRAKVLKVIKAGQAADKLKSQFLATVDAQPDKREDTAARAARRAISDLKAAQILGTWEDWLWLN